MTQDTDSSAPYPGGMRAFALAVPVLLLAACGGGTTSGGTPTPDVNALIGKSFTATALTSGGSAQPIASGSTIHVQFSADNVSIKADCNTMNGPATYTPTQIMVEQMATTMMACAPALMTQDQWLADFFTADPNWKLDGTTLTLTQGTSSMTLVTQ